LLKGGRNTEGKELIFKRRAGFLFIRGVGRRARPPEAKKGREKRKLGLVPAESAYPIYKILVRKT